MIQVEELAKSKLEKPKRLRQAAARDWGEIALGTLRFDRPEAEVAALRTLTHADLVAFLDVWDSPALALLSCVAMPVVLGNGV